MPSSDHNPHQRRLYLPVVRTNGDLAVDDPEEVADTHVAHSVGCAQTVRPAGRRPEWLRVKARTGPNYSELKDIMRSQSLHTVCEEAGCPNIYECWEDREATFLILGDRCTRRCGFCDVRTARPAPVDWGEPRRVAKAVEAMGLRYVVVTGVARDDLPDGGAAVWAACIRAIRAAVPGCGVEVLPADFKGGEADIAKVIEAEDLCKEFFDRFIGFILHGAMSYINCFTILQVFKITDFAGSFHPQRIITGAGSFAGIRPIGRYIRTMSRRGG